MKYSSNKDFQVYIASLVASKKWTYKKQTRQTCLAVTYQRAEIARAEFSR